MGVGAAITAAAVGTASVLGTTRRVVKNKNKNIYDARMNEAAERDAEKEERKRQEEYDRQVKEEEERAQREYDEQRALEKRYADRAVERKYVFGDSGGGAADMRGFIS